MKNEDKNNGTFDFAIALNVILRLLNPKWMTLKWTEDENCLNWKSIERKKKLLFYRLFSVCCLCECINERRTFYCDYYDDKNTSTFRKFRRMNWCIASGLCLNISFSFSFLSKYNLICIHVRYCGVSAVEHSNLSSYSMYFRFWDFLSFVFVYF